MFLHNLKLILRQLAKNKVHSFLGITSIAFGFAVSFVIALFIHHEFTMDSIYPNRERVYEVVDPELKRARMYHDDRYYLAENFPEIEEVCAAEFHGQWARPVYTGERPFYLKSSITTDNSFFRLFSIEIIEKIAEEPFSQRNSVVLTQSAAKLLFGDSNPLGREITIDRVDTVFVSAVIADFHEKSSIDAQILLNSENVDIRASYMGDRNGFDRYSTSLYLLLKEHASKDALIVKIRENLDELKTQMRDFDLIRLDEIYMGEPHVGTGHAIGSPALVLLFGIVGGLLLSLSVINHITFILSYQMKKLKEIGIKKTSGAGFWNLMTYILLEVSVWVLLSLALALILVELSMPLTSNLLGCELSLKMLDGAFLAYLSLVVLCVVSVSTAVPAWLLAKFDIRNFLTGFVGAGVSNYFRKATTVFQFCVATILLAAVLVVQEQIDFIKNRDVGFEKEQLLQVEFPLGFEQASTISNRIVQDPDVLSCSLSQGNPAYITHRSTAYNEYGDSFQLNRIFSDWRFPSTFQLEILHGRYFDEDERGRLCLLNETAFKKYGWESLDGNQFVDGMRVVGVYKDFHTQSLRYPIQAVVIELSERNFRTLNLRISGQGVARTLDGIRDAIRQLSPQTPFEYQFFDDWYDQIHKNEERFASAINLFAVVAFFITCFGLLGQTIETCLKRTKEVGIRKSMGASAASIGVMLTGSFMRTAIIANVIAIPISWFLMSEWLSHFDYRIELTAMPLFLAGVVTIAISALTVSWQSIRTASANPVEALRYE